MGDFLFILNEKGVGFSMENLKKRHERPDSTSQDTMDEGMEDESLHSTTMEPSNARDTSQNSPHGGTKVGVTASMPFIDTNMRSEGSSMVLDVQMVGWKMDEGAESEWSVKEVGSLERGACSERNMEREEGDHPTLKKKNSEHSDEGKEKSRCLNRRKKFRPRGHKNGKVPDKVETKFDLNYLRNALDKGME